MTKPNFFILGAPKCGTTSLAAWLTDHPQVFFSPVKEPHFFIFDSPERRFRSLAKYEELFSDATTQHIAVGEASVRYLDSRTAVPAILEYTDEPRFIVMVRNPVDMAYSLHEQTVFNGDEDEKNFEIAWELQSTRVYGGDLPKSCVDPQRLLYGRLCRLGEHLQRLYEVVPREQVLVVNLEHLKCDARKEYRRVLAFLRLADDGRQDFPVMNAAKKRRYPKIWQGVRWMNRSLRAVGVPHIRLGLTEFVYYRGWQERPRPPMSETMRSRLQQYFAQDITLLEKLTGWKLSHWKSENVC